MEQKDAKVDSVELAELGRQDSVTSERVNDDVFTVLDVAIANEFATDRATVIDIDTVKDVDPVKAVDAVKDAETVKDVTVKDGVTVIDVAAVKDIGTAKEVVTAKYVVTVIDVVTAKDVVTVIDVVTAKDVVTLIDEILKFSSMRENDPDLDESAKPSSISSQIDQDERDVRRLTPDSATGGSNTTTSITLTSSGRSNNEANVNYVSDVEMKINGAKFGNNSNSSSVRASSNTHVMEHFDTVNDTKGEQIMGDLKSKLEGVEHEQSTQAKTQGPFFKSETQVFSELSETTVRPEPSVHNHLNMSNRETSSYTSEGNKGVLQAETILQNDQTKEQPRPQALELQKELTSALSLSEVAKESLQAKTPVQNIITTMLTLDSLASPISTTNVKTQLDDPSSLHPIQIITVLQDATIKSPADKPLQSVPDITIELPINNKQGALNTESHLQPIVEPQLISNRTDREATAIQSTAIEMQHSTIPSEPPTDSLVYLPPPLHSTQQTNERSTGVSSRLESGRTTQGPILLKPLLLN